MRFSFIVLDRIATEKAASDEEYRRVLEKNGKRLLRDGRALSDDDLLAKLRAMGIHFDRAGFLRATEPFPSAEEMAETVYADPPRPLTGAEQDWVWIAFACLWERWSPDRPSMEMIDDWMQEGYRLDAGGDTVGACRAWLKTWKAIWDIVEARQLRSTEEFDDLFRGTNSLFNWVQDFTLALSNAGREDVAFNEERRAVLEALLSLPQLDEGLLFPSRNDLAEAYFDLGQSAKGEALYRQWLRESPRWGWGWICWSDKYYIFADDRAKDAVRAEEILKQGLAVPGVEDRKVMLDRLADLYQETGRTKEAEAVRAEMQQTRPTARSVPSPVARPVPLPAPRASPFPHVSPAAPAAPVGRNDPCPCGSGKKYKKCCLGK